MWRPLARWLEEHNFSVLAFDLPVTGLRRPLEPNSRCRGDLGDRLRQVWVLARSTL